MLDVPIVGKSRMYSPVLALTVLVIGELRRKGLTFQQVKPIIPGIKKALRDRHNKISDLLLVVDETGKVIATILAAAAVTFLAESSGAMRVVDVGALAARLPQIPKSEQEPAA